MGINGWVRAPNVLVRLIWGNILSLLCLILLVSPTGPKSKVGNSVLDVP